ncbi:MAG: hypothetical protein CMK09_01930 [Ponticaulis sp.]|nr:hypothetical protein [Ponticaulis sp.]|tara:strand:+ start:6663 stop:7454 length:792 start_codon:yes stop_codon:yes gene_type:complete
MGTHWSARFFAHESFLVLDAERALNLVFDEIIAEFSTWEEASVISRINQSTPETAISVSEQFEHVWEQACRVSEESRGAFNPGLSDWKTARSRLQNSMIRRHARDALDLSAIAKGYAVDQMADSLQSLGVTSLLVEIGGEFVGRGLKPSGQPWWLEVEKPTSHAESIRVAMPGYALATSAHRYQSEFTKTGFKSHISGQLDDIHATVTVIARDCMMADAWATALLAAGAQGPELAEENRLVAVFQAGDGKCVLSSDAKTLLED